MYVTPLTAAERERAKKDARSDDPGAFALQLLIRKAKNGNNQPLFTPGDAAVLKNEVRDSDLQEADARRAWSRRGRRTRYEKP